MKKQVSLISFLAIFLFLAVYIAYAVPGFTELANNASTVSKNQSQVNFSVTLVEANTSGFNLSQYVWSFVNLSAADGVWVNETALNANNTGHFTNITKTIGVAKGTLVCGKVYVNNTNSSNVLGAFNESQESCFTVANSGPTLTSFSNVTLVQGTSATVDLGSNAADLDADPLNWSVTAENSSQVDCNVLSVSAGTINLTANSTFNGSASCTLSVTDASVSASNPLNISVSIANPSLSVSTVAFGDVEQNSSNTKSFTISNNGNVVLTGISMNESSVENVTFTNFSTSLAVNASDSVTANLSISAGHTTGSLTVPVTVFSNENNFSFSLTANVLGKLRIKDLDVTVDGEKDSNLNNGDKIGKDAMPKSKVRFDIEFENVYSKDENIEIQDVEVTITIEDIDDGDDIDEDADEFDIEADKKEDVSVEFDIPLEADEDDYDVKIEAEGKDERGITQSLTWELTLEVKKERNNIAIQRAILSPTTVSCNRRASLDVKVQNLGRDEEDEVAVAVESSALGISIYDAIPFELDNDVNDKDSEYSKVYSLDISDDIRPGTYAVEIRSFYDFSKVTDFERVNLKVEECSTGEEPEEEEEPEDEKEVVVVQPPTTGQENIKPGQTSKSDGKLNFKDTGAYAVLLVLGFLIVFSLVGAVLFQVFRKS